MRSIILILIALLIYGCTSFPQSELEKTTEDCPISGQEIEEICGIKLHNISFQDETCRYDTNEDYGVKMATYDRKHTIDDVTKLDFVVNVESSYEFLDIGNESVYTSVVTYWKGSPFRRSSSIYIFVDDKEYFINGFSEGREFDGCTSKDDLIKTAKLYYERTQSEDTN